MYNKYNVDNNIVVQPYNMGVTLKSIVLFLFLNSCYLVLMDSPDFVIDYSQMDPYLVEFPSEIQKLFISPINDFYLINNYCDYKESGWGLFFNVKTHKFLIYIWWLWVLRKVIFCFKKEYKDIFI